MRYSLLTAVVLVTGMLLAGCTPDRYRPIYRLPDIRHDRRGVDYRIDNDVRAFVRYLDRNLRLSSSQARKIDRMLTERTYDLLDRNRSARIYPFPRRYYRDQHRTVQKWWASTDKRIERYLNRQQRRIYRDMVKYDFRNKNQRYEPRGRTTDRRDLSYDL